MKKRMMVGMLTMLWILLLTGCQKPKDDGIKGILAQTEHGEWMFLETEGEETKWACLEFVTEYSEINIDNLGLHTGAVVVIYHTETIETLPPYYVVKSIDIYQDYDETTLQQVKDAWEHSGLNFDLVYPK